MSGITTASAAALLPVLPAAFVIAPTSDHKKLKKKKTYFSHFDHFGLFDEPIYPDSVTGTCSNEVLYDIIPPGSISSLKQFLHNIFSVYIRHTTSLHWKNLEFHAFSQCTQSLNAFTLKSAKLS